MTKALYSEPSKTFLRSGVGIRGHSEGLAVRHGRITVQADGSRAGDEGARARRGHAEVLVEGHRYVAVEGRRASGCVEPAVEHAFRVFQSSELECSRISGGKEPR